MSDTQVTETKPQSPARRVQYLRPHYEITSGKEAHTVQAYVPGVSKDGVNITVENDTLSIEARRSFASGESWKPRYREIPQADYRLRLDLNVPVDEENITAQTVNGVLTITLPVAEASKPRKITVN